MYKLLLLLALPYVLLAQYSSDAGTEKYFENSALYFKSNMLNPYGVSGFDKVGKGMIDHPLMRVQVNPGLLPQLDTNNALIYFDFRGDKYESEYVEQSAIPFYSMYSSFIPEYTPYTMYKPRTESEPLFSAGAFFNPLGALTPGLVTGITYQLIQKDEPYYVYRNMYYYRAMAMDAFGNKVVADEALPTVERQSGKNDMSTEAHLLSLYAGYQISPSLQAGLIFSSTMHERNGAYGNGSRSEFGTSYEYPYEYRDFEDRSMEYQHTDISAGIVYRPKQSLLFGLKAGILSGTADQKFNRDNKSYNQYNTPEVDTNWNYLNSSGYTHQQWKHDGNTIYAGVNMQAALTGDRTVTGYYEYRKTNLDISNSTRMFDSSYSTYRYSYYYNTPQWYSSKNRTKSSELRNATGEKTMSEHEAMVSMCWELSSKTKISIGARMYSANTSISSTEPVLSSRYSSWQYNSNQSGSSGNSLYEQTEDKTLYWDYTVKEWSFSIPVLLQQSLGQYFELMLGVSRDINRSSIEEEMLAVFKSRSRNDNGQLSSETNFGEWYRSPAEKKTEQYFDAFMGLKAKAGKDITIQVLFNPDLEPLVKMEQWSIGCSLAL